MTNVLTMKLGIWNRLALAATALALILAPAWFWMGKVDSFRADRIAAFETCIRSVERSGAVLDTFSEAASGAVCREQAFPRDDPSRPGLEQWGELLLKTLAVCVVVYLLISAAIFAVTRAKADPPAA